MVLLTVFSVTSVLSLFKKAPAAQADMTTEEVWEDTTAWDETTAQGETTLEGQTTAEGETTAQDETTLEGQTTAPGDTTTAGPGTTAAPVNTVPTTKEGVLAAYTAVMNKAKKDAPGYKKKEFQVLPEGDSYRQFEKGGTLVSIMLNLAGLFMVTEQDAKTEDTAKGSDMKWFPVYKAFPNKVASPGCLLTNVGAIKSAQGVKLADGNYKLTIVLNPEDNPEPYKEGQAKATSNTGNMFSPLSKADINDTLVNNSSVNKVIRNASYKLTYYNCTAELVYNPKTSHIVSLNQYMSVKIFILPDTKVGFSSVVGWATLKNTLNIWDFKY